MLDLFTLFASAESESIAEAADAASSAAPAGGGLMNTILNFAIIPLMLIALYFIMIRPQQKRTKAERALRDNLQVGDEVVTIGGIVGIVTNIKDENVTIETSAQRTAMLFRKSSIASVETVHEED